MPRNVTVVFADGQAKVYTDVPDDVTPDQIEAEARRQYPDLQISKIMGEDIVLAELRDAIASRTATMDDLDEIARRYNRVIPDNARRSFQAWLDTARDRPDVPIPENIFTGPVSRTEASIRGFATGALEDVGALDFIRPFADTVNTGLARGMDAFSGVLGTSARDIANWSGRNFMGLSQADIDAAFERAGNPQNYLEASANAFSRARAGLGELATEAQRQRPNYYGVSRFAGNVAPVALTAGGAGGALAFTGRAAPVAASYVPALARAMPTVTRVGEGTRRFGQLVGTGGFGPGARGLSTLSSIGARGAAGATAGVIGAEVLNQDPAEAAAIGAFTPLLATAGRQGLGAAYDLLARRFGDVRAAEIFRNLIADKAGEIAAALREAPANIRANTAQFLETRGLLTPELASATRAVARTAEGAPLQNVAARRTAGQAEDLLELQGGGSALEAAQNANAMREAVRAETDPLLQEAMRAANVGRTQIIPAEREAARLGEAAAEEARRAARFYRAGDEQSMVLNQMDDLGDAFDPQAINRQRGIVGALDERGLGFGQRSVDLGSEAARARAVAEDLRAQGFAPIDITGVVGNLRSLAREALPQSNRRRLFSGFADVLEARAAEEGGVIGGESLHMAKREMGDFVASVLGQADPSAISRGTSMMVGATQKLITDALDEAAGAGSPFSVFNDAFSTGMRNIEQQGVATRLARLGRTDTARGGDRGRFEDIVRGEDLDFVPEILGPGKYDINTALSAPNLSIAQRLADEFASDRRVRALGLDMSPDVQEDVASGINDRVRQMFEPGQKNWLARALTRVPGAAAAPGGGAASDQLAQQLSRAISRNVMGRLAPALANPAEAVRLAGVRSVNAMTAGAFDRLGLGAQALIGQSAQQLLAPTRGATAGPPPGQVFLGFQTGPSGEAIPIYGPAGGL
jgi:hypothetical protein